jgi:ATP-binding cassette subfamily C protein CydCD
MAGYAAVQLSGAVLTVVQVSALARVIAAIVRREPAADLGPALLTVLLAGGGRAMLAAAQEWLGARGSLRVRAALRGSVLDAVRRLGPVWAAEQPPGRLLTAAGPGLDAVDGYLARALPALVGASIVPGLVLAWVVAVDLRSAAILVIVLPLVPLFMVLIGVTTNRRMRRQYETLSRLSGHFLDLVAGLTTLRVYGCADRQVAAVRTSTDTYRRQTLSTLRTAFLSGLVLDLLATLSIAVVAVDVGLRLDGGRVSLVTALVVLLLAPEIFAPLRALGAQHHASEEGRVAIGAALDIVTAAADRPVRPRTGDVPATGSVTLQGVTIAYADRARDAVHQVDLALTPGEVVVLRGPSGAGKSTLLACLLRFVTPDEGSIGTGDRPFADTVDADAWRRLVAWLPQRPCPTQRTVGEEIALGDPTADARRVGDVIARCHAPHAGTVLGEDGDRVSAGQRRRVALARAMLRAEAVLAAGAVPLMLLDEPSEDLDRNTERVVAAVIGDLAGRATVVVATHSATLARAADRVVELADGHIVADRRQVPVRTTAAPKSPPVPPTVPPTGPTMSGPLLSQPPMSESPAASGLAIPVRKAARLLAAAGGLAGLSGLAGLALTATSLWLICRAAQHPNVQALAVAVVGVRTFALGRAELRYLERLVAHDGALRLLADVRVRVFAALVPRVPGGVDLRRGDLLRRFIVDVDGVQEGFVRAVVPAVGAVLTGAGAVTLAALLVPVAGGWLALGLLIGLVAAPAVARLIAGSGTVTARAAAARDAAVVGTFDGLAELTAYGAVDHALATVRAGDARVLASARRAAVGAAAGVGLAGWASAATMAAVLAAAANAAAQHRLGGVTAAVLAACVIAAFDAIGAVPAVCSAWGRFRAGWRRVAQVLAAPVPMPMAERPVSLPTGATGVRFVKAAVAPGRNVAPVLTDIDLDVRPGRRLAVVGPSGCGKSTLLASALRLLPVSSGTVEITRPQGPLDLRRVVPTDVPRVIAGSLQGDHVFDTTLRDNLRVVRPDAGDDQLDAVAERAGLGPVVRALPAGWNTLAGADGANLSGGQRQRLLLARALLAAPDVLILDEPTAHLDADTADVVMADLLQATRTQTVLLSTHRALPEGATDAVLDLAQSVDDRVRSSGRVSPSRSAAASLA